MKIEKYFKLSIGTNTQKKPDLLQGLFKDVSAFVLAIRLSDYTRAMRKDNAENQNKCLQHLKTFFWATSVTWYNLI